MHACCKNTSSRMKLLLPFMDKKKDVKLVAPPLKPKDRIFSVKDAIILV